MEIITSKNNASVMAAAKLADKKYREREGKFAFEGIKLFEEAYFVMRKDTLSSSDDMVGEANRIIDSCAPKKKERNGSRISLPLVALSAFMGGSVFGGSIALLVVLV